MAAHVAAGKVLADEEELALLGLGDAEADLFGLLPHDLREAGALHGRLALLVELGHHAVPELRGRYAVVGAEAAHRADRLAQTLAVEHTLLHAQLAVLGELTGALERHLA